MVGPDYLGSVIVFLFQQSRQWTMILYHLILALFLLVILIIHMVINVGAHAGAVRGEWVNPDIIDYIYFIPDLVEVVAGAGDAAVLAGMSGSIVVLVLQPSVVEDGGGQWLLVWMGLMLC